MSVLGRRHLPFAASDLPVIGDVEREAGNVLLPIGRAFGDGTFRKQSSTVTLTISEVVMLIERLEEIQDVRIYRELLQHCRDHQNTEDDNGYSCDERGCGICNADSDEDAAERWFEMWQEGLANLPFDEEEV